LDAPNACQNKQYGQDSKDRKIFWSYIIRNLTTYIKIMTSQDICLFVILH